MPHKGKGRKHQTALPIYNFPRGKIIPKETPEDCAAREVAEETSYEIAGQFDSQVFFKAKVFFFALHTIMTNLIYNSNILVGQKRCAVICCPRRF
jgi:8-oxo-dGTP pyrophosphatase MutT (NUDIX family)